MKKSDLTHIFLGVLILAAVIFIVALQYSDIKDNKEYNNVSIEERDNSIEVINADKWEVFSSRNIEDIVSKYNAMVSSVDNDHMYEVMPIDDEGYNIGSLSESAFDSVLSIVNYYRWLEGVPEVSISKTDSMGMQAAAYIYVLAEKINDVMENRPDEMPVEIYRLCTDTVPDGIVSWTTFNTCIKDSMNDGFDFENDSIIGGRMSLMSYNTKNIAVGYYSNVFTCSGYSDEQGSIMIYPFVSYPSPGIFPANEIDKELSSWHIELNRNMIDYGNADDIKVVITDITDGRVYDRDKENGLYTKDNFIIFYPPEEEGVMYAHEYCVQVYGLRSVSGKELSIKYTVRFFDRNDYDFSEIVNVDYDAETIYVPQDMPDIQIVELMPDSISAELMNGKKISVQLLGWAKSVSEKQGLLEDSYIAVIDKENLNQYAVDSKNLLSSCYIDIIKYNEDISVVKSELDSGNIELMVEFPVEEAFLDIEWYVVEEDKLSFVGAGESIIVDVDKADKVYVAKVIHENFVRLVN